MCVSPLTSTSVSVRPSRHLPLVMTQQMQNLQLSQTRKCPGGPASPSAAKRLYRNLSEKLRGSTSSFEDTYFFGKTDRLRKASVSLQDGTDFESYKTSHTSLVCCKSQVLEFLENLFNKDKRRFLLNVCG